MSARPNLPRGLDRAVKVEAGHRCGIPTCREHPIDVAHIEQRKPDGSNDVFDNLIALCPNCHARYDRNEIDRLAMLQYKTNLSVLNSRYGDLERRVLQHFADGSQFEPIPIPGGLRILLKYLLDDGFVRIVSRGDRGEGEVSIVGVPAQEYVALTVSGRNFIARWLQAKDLDEPSLAERGQE